LDTYFRGNSQELQFCKTIGAGGNHLVAATAGGQRLGTDGQLKLREKELDAVLQQFQQLPRGERQPQLAGDGDVQPPQREVPKPPAGGLVVRGYCTYLAAEDDGQIARIKQFYYKENPDRWAAETQSDMLWLTEQERHSLIPADAKVGATHEVDPHIQRRFFSTVGIDYMEGSVNSLPTRSTRLTLTVERVTPQRMVLRLDGYGQMGKELNEKSRTEPHSRGCALRVLGYVEYDREKDAVDRFDVVGVGKAWGNKMNYVGRAIRLDEYPWTYGIACELVAGDSPMDLIPPYNLLHYGSAGPYFNVSK
jgi:hypothetical protein